MSRGFRHQCRGDENAEMDHAVVDGGKRNRFVPPATAADLGVIRIVVFGLILANVCFHDLPSVAELPAGIRREMGVMQLVHRIPGWDRMYSDGQPCGG